MMILKKISCETKRVGMKQNLPWKTNHPDLPTNETGSRRRLNNLVKRLERNETYQRYDDIIQGQIEQNIIELAPAEVTGKEFYIPHKGIVRQPAQTTKLLGLSWDKSQDTLSVTTNKEKPASTKRAALSQLAKVIRPPRFGIANDIAWEAPLSGNV